MHVIYMSEGEKPGKMTLENLVFNLIENGVDGAMVKEMIGAMREQAFFTGSHEFGRFIVVDAQVAASL